MALCIGVGARFALRSYEGQSKLPPASTAAPLVAPADSVVGALAMPQIRSAAPSPPVLDPPNPIYHEELYCRGYVARGDRINVAMSDGTVITEKTALQGKGLEIVDRERVVVGGRVFAIKRDPVSDKNLYPPAGEASATRVSAFSEAIKSPDAVSTRRQNPAASKPGSTPRSVEPEAKTSFGARRPGLVRPRGQR